MSRDLNKVIFIGNMTADAELRYTPGGSSVVDFSVACNNSYTTKDGEKKEEVTFFECQAWEKQAEVIAQYCKKGHRVGVEGRMKQQRWEDKDGTKRSKMIVAVESIQFLTPKSGGAEG